MKTLRFFLLMAILLMAGSCATSSYLPFAGSTKNKPVKRMTSHQVNKAAKGCTYYQWKHSKLTRR